MAWALKDKEIQLFRDTITTYKVSLDMALSAMTFSTIASLNKRTKRFESDFKEEFRDIVSRLQALDNDRFELASVAGCNGSEWYGTEADFAMKRFLEYTELLRDSPPASFPGSPIQPPSEDCDGVNTQQGIPDTASPCQLSHTNSTMLLTGKQLPKFHGATAMLMCMEDYLQVPIVPAFFPEPGNLENERPGTKTLDPAMNQDTEVDQPSMDDALSPKSSPEFIYVKAKPQTSRASADPITPGLKDIYSKSGFDAVKVLWLIAIRRNPQFNIDAIDISCSFVVCDITLEDCPIVYISDSFQTVTGYSRHEDLGRNCRFLQAPDGKVERGSPRLFGSNGTVYTLKKSVQERRKTQINMINFRKGGKPFLNYLSIISIPWDTDEIRYYVGF
ncbi:hypothetical protein BFJ68_g2449 [Fusarium oxysporum]|uniref:PAS domain-containing protein n=2 Tax=Fusarium oxysporum TaxID=5507 RepID=A0A420RVV3_FUSOX|nr:hypothetical protein BFJ68_g2449 [Fusarium oxysporum]